MPVEQYRSSWTSCSFLDWSTSIDGLGDCDLMLHAQDSLQLFMGHIQTNELSLLLGSVWPLDSCPVESNGTSPNEDLVECFQYCFFLRVSIHILFNMSSQGLQIFKLIYLVNVYRTGELGERYWSVIRYHHILACVQSMHIYKTAIHSLGQT